MNNVQSTADTSQLNVPHGTNNKVEKLNNGYAQKYRQTVRGNPWMSPEKEKEGYGEKDLQKTKVSSLE